ncbi:hypothetical protein Halru_2493 [Halovivax ruber XH-70]|uniref:Major facilitator superfamily (MFS) profile domain-containing protein n=1 Tax=Halovivax ruber (strain DSM 18193 / JCM 13892 / XH-70) TaxID=797302 RepID=L0IBX4_HALRX|nr:hypothetical protein [Halovivax ruber]AGB17075.1 hypothetical protein Halru_2493 [Halovivax ruber XH-70]
MDVTQVALGTILLVAAGLITVGQSVAGSTPALHAIALLGVCLTLAAGIVGEIRNEQRE